MSLLFIIGSHGGFNPFLCFVWVGLLAIEDNNCNVQSFESSGQFVVDHYRIDFDVNGGFIEIDSSFKHNFMMGWTNFSSPLTANSLMFETIFT